MTKEIVVDKPKLRRGEHNVKDSLRFTLYNKVATPIVYISFP